MNTLDLIEEITATYRKHGWTLRRVLLHSATRAAIDAKAFGEAGTYDSDFDALWFSRPSHAGREAWELRLVDEQQYALFEAFEADESEEEREDVRREMENRMREYFAQDQV